MAETTNENPVFVDERTSLKTSFPDNAVENEKSSFYKVLAYVQRVPKRYILTLMAFLGFANLYAMRVNLSAAIVAMTNNYTIVKDNITVFSPADFDWDTKTQGTVLSAFFYGYIITQLPGGFLAKWLGGKLMFGGFTFIAALFTLITPQCARWSVSLLIVIRVLVGLAEGVAFPSIHALWAEWAPPQEKTKLANYAFSGSFFGVVICLPLAGAMSAGPAGWSAIFYLIGCLGIVWFIVWWYIIDDSPNQHPTISPDERDMINTSLGTVSQRHPKPKIPWYAMATSLPLWAMVAAHFAENWGFYTLLAELPTFMNDVLHFKLHSAGFLAAVPYLAMGIALMLASHLADYVRVEQFFTTTTVRKIFTCGAMTGQLLFMLCTGFVTNGPAAVACLTVAVGLGGFAWAGFGVNNLDIAPPFASIVMGVSNMFATIPGVISPSITGSIVIDKTSEEWRVIFFVTCGIYAFGIMIFALLASGERQPWAEVVEYEYETYQQYENEAVDTN